MKCRKAHPNSSIALCPFNPQHHIPKNNMKRHEFECPDRVFIENLVEAKTSSTKRRMIANESQNIKKPRESNEDDEWDNVCKNLLTFLRTMRDYVILPNRRIEVQWTKTLTTRKLRSRKGQPEMIDPRPGTDFSFSLNKISFDQFYHVQFRSFYH
jgi:U11-48K-like CHHC zinc finger